jgi:hypothetical protein
MPDINQVPVPNGLAANCWGSRGAPGVTSLLFINQDINNTVWIGQISTITPAGPNTIPIAPNGTFSGAASSAWYVVGSAAGIQPLVVVPNGAAYFLGLTQGMGNLAIPSIRSPNFVTGISGWQISKNGNAEFNNITIRGGTVISGTALGYNGTPAPGNLAYSESVTGGIDQFGNVYKAGVWIYGANNAAAGLELFGGDAGVVFSPPGSAHLTSDPQIFGSNFNANAVNETEALTLFSGQAASLAGAEFVIISEAADASSPASIWMLFNNSIVWDFQPNFTTYTGALQITSNVSAAFYIAPAIAAPAAIAGNVQYYGNANGIPAAVTETGLTGTLPVVQVDVSTNGPGNTATAGVLSKPWLVPANDGVKGTAYTIKARAGIGTGATTIETLTIGAEINSTLVPLATLGVAFNGGALSTAYDIPLELVLIVDAVGTGTPEIYLNGPLGDTSANRAATNSANMSGHSITAAWNKAAANTLAIYAQWGGAGGAGQTAQTLSSRFYREGP